MELVLIVIAFVIGIFVGSKYENDRYPQKLENDLQIFMERFQDDIKAAEKEYNMMHMANAELRAIRKENEEQIEQQERNLNEKDNEINKKQQEILRLHEIMDDVLAEKRDLIEMVNMLMDKIRVEPFMEFTSQSNADLDKLARDYARDYLNMTQSRVGDLEYAEDDDINKLQFKYATILIKNVLIADLDRRFITDYLTKPSEPPVEKQPDKEIDADYDEKVKQGVELAKKVFGHRDDA